MPSLALCLPPERGFPGIRRPFHQHPYSLLEARRLVRPSDFSDDVQDMAGTTPVTAVEQACWFDSG